MKKLFEVNQLLKMKDSVENSLKFECGICGGWECSEIILKENQLIKIVYQRGQIFLCNKCFQDSILFDNFAYRIMKPYLKIRRKLGL